MSEKIPPDVEKLIVDLYKNGDKHKEIEKITGVAGTTIKKIIKNYVHDGKLNGRVGRYGTNEKEKVISLYLGGETIKEIGRLLKISARTCSRIIQSKIKDGSIKKVESNFCKNLRSKREKTIELYKNGLNYSEIEKELGVNEGVVRRKVLTSIIKGETKKMEKTHPELIEGTTASTVLRLYKEGLTQSEISRKLKISINTVIDYIFRMKEHGTIVEKTLGETIADDPKYLEKDDIPGSQISKSTVQIGPDGDIQRQWVRLVPEAQDVELWLKSMEERARLVAPPQMKITKDVNEDLMLEIPIPDIHMGALAWDEETGGDNYDVKIAKEIMVAGFGSLLADVPKVGKLVLVVLGDFYHADNKEGTTSRSGNILDTDSRFAKRVDYGIEALRECIMLAATRAKIVEVIIIAGNHDDHSATWLSRILAANYTNNKQIRVSTKVTFRQYVEFGKVMLGYMHGHEMKTQRLVNLIPAEQPQMWGRTKYRYARLGHWHHRLTEEFQGITVEVIPTVAAPDSYAAQHGFSSRRAMVGYLYHSEFGLRSKLERSIEEIKSYANKLMK